MTQGLFAGPQDGQHLCFRTHQQLRNKKTPGQVRIRSARLESVKRFLKMENTRTLAEMAEAAAVLMPVMTSPSMTCVKQTEYSHILFVYLSYFNVKCTFCPL